MEIASREVGAGVFIRPLVPLHPPPHPHTEHTGGSVLGRFLSSSISSRRESHRAERDEKMELMEGKEGGREVKFI